LTRRNLPDLNVLLALIDDEHMYYRTAQDWFNSSGKENWGLCPLTESGLVRLVTNPVMGPMYRTFDEAKAILEDLAQRSGYSYWPITESWAMLTAPITERIFGHRQVTDAYLLGLAIKEDGVLVTFDRGLKYLAGPEFSKNLLILE